MRKLQQSLILVLFIVLGYAEQGMSQVSGYEFRKKYEVNASQVSGSSNLTNFPVLFSVTDTDLRTTSNGGDVENPNGYDIIFTSGDGSTILAHQIESYDAASGTLVFWVRFPTLSPTSDTPFYLYYGNSSVSTDPSTSNVWDNNFKMVHHMSNNADDASGNGTDGVESGTTDGAGQIGRARVYGTNQGDLIQVPDNGSSPLDITGNITISFWVNITNRNDGPDLVSKGDYLDGYSTWVTNIGNLRFQINSDVLTGSSNNQITNNNWAYLTFTRSNSGRRIYLNGTLDASDASTTSFNTNNDPLFISTLAFDFEGRMDEVRISNIERSADWIQTEYNNQNNPGAFITNINSEPVLSDIEGSAATFTSGDAPLAITSTLDISDDDANLSSATVSITSNFNASEDLLDFTDQLGITGSYNSTNGVLTLSGSSSVANYITALRSVTYENTSAFPAEITRSITFTVDDGTDSSNSQSRDIDIIQVNNSPLLSGIESTPLVVFPGDGPKSITTQLLVQDIDDTNLSSAQISITGNFQSTEDVLGFTNQNGITGSYSSGTGVLDLSGTATVTDYKEAIRSVTYQNISATPSQTTRTVTITANDGNSDSSPITRDIQIATVLTDPSTDFSNTVFHFDAQDVDGDLQTNDQPADGSGVGTWGDRSDNAGGSTTDLSANDVLGQPTFDSNYLGGRGGIEFSSGQSLEPNNNGILNTGTFDEKSFAAVFRTGASTAGLQVVYEQGAQVRGYQISIKDGNAYAFVWNNAEWGAADEYKSIDLGPVQPNTSYIIIASHDATDATLANRIWQANINGRAITTLNTVDVQRSHSGNAVIGAEDGSVDPVTEAGNPAGNNEFNGIVAELISWNTALSSNDFSNLYAYLSDKWFNEPPVLAGIEASAIPYNEGDPATLITATVTLSDADDTNLDSVQVRIASGLNASEDVLNYPAVIGSITGSFNSTTGILTLSGADTPANYQAAIRSVTYQNTNAISPSTDDRIIEIVAYDWDDASGVVVRTVNILPVNDDPVLASIEGSVFAYTEGDGETPFTSTITISDTDDTNLESAIIQITGNYFLGEDELTFTNANGISGSFQASTGTLTLTGTSSLANYQTALRSVNYNNLSPDPVTSLDRTVTITVNDGTNDSNTQQRDISVTATNTAPLLSAIEPGLLLYSIGSSLIVSETISVDDLDNTDITTATIQITGNYDSAEDSLTFQDLFGITDSWDNVSGTLTLTGPANLSDFQDALRTVRYENTSSNPSDDIRTVSFIVSDGAANSNTESRDVSVSPVTAVPDLELWLKGDDGTFTTTGGTTQARNDLEDVGRWEDQSGNGNHFISTGADDLPVLRTNVGTINAQNAIEFPGGGSEVRLEDADAESQYLNGLTEFTIFFVIESDVTGTDQGFWTTFEPDANNEDKFFSIRYDATGNLGSGSNVIKTALREDISSFELESSEDVQTTNGQIIALTWESEDFYDLYIDGVLDNPTASGVIPSGLFTNLTTAIIGQGTQDQNDSWDGLIAEVILYTRNISATERESVEDYLSEKYSIPIRLLTKATGGEAISADDSAVSTAFTTLTGPRLQEGFIGELTQNGTIVLQAPAGYEWDTGGSNPSASVAAAFGGTTNLAVSFTSRTASQITFTITNASTTNQGEITFSDLRVRPTTGILPNTGEITNVGTTGLGGTTSYGTLTMVAGTRISMEFTEQPSTSNVSTDINPAPRVQFIDQFGNPVEDTGVNISVSLNQVSGTGSLTGTLSESSNTFGLAEFDDIQVDDTGSYSLRASSTGLSDVDSDTFDVVVLGQLTQFLVERVPSGNISAKTAGTNFNIRLTAVDGAAATVTSFNGTAVITSNCTLGTGQGTTPAFTNGVLSSLTVSITNVGNCSITATNSLGAQTGTSNTFTVSAGTPSAAGTLISASPTVILNDGFSTSTITVDVKDAFGNNISSGGATVLLNTTLGSLTSVTDNSDGTYTATLTSSTVLGNATISGSLNGNAITDQASVEFAAFSTIWQSQIGAIPDARNWDDPANWSAGAVPSAGDIVLIPANPAVGNEFPVIDQNNTEITQISVEASATVTVSGGINFIVSGDATGGGSIQGSNVDTLQIGGDVDVANVTIGEVELNGSSKQVLSSPHDFNDLEIDNSAGVDAAEDLTVSGTLSLTSGSLLIPSGKTLIANDKDIGAGNLRFQRIVNGVRGWRLISSPVNSTFGDLLDGTLTQGFTGSTLGAAPLDSLQPNVLTYDETFPGTDNQRYRAPANASASLTAGQGMFVFFFGSIPADSRYNDPLPDTLDISGQEFEGTGSEVDFGITYTAAADTGFNLIGNPYGATINWDHPSWTKTNVDNTIYIWDPAANGGNGEYLTWNGVTGTLGSGRIPPFQGFWVKATAASPSLIVSEDAKTNGGNFLRKEAKGGSESENPPLIRLQLRNQDLIKQTNIMFSNAASVRKDPLDAYELSPFSASRVELHSLLEDGSALAINNLPLNFTNRIFVPLQVNGYRDGAGISDEFELTLLGLRQVPDDWVITLIDNDTGEEIDLKTQSRYTFFHSTREKYVAQDPLQPRKLMKSRTSNRYRFTLIISTEEIEANIPREAFLDQNYPNPFNPSTVIPFGLDVDSDVKLEVFDILGRRVLTLADQRYQAGRYEIRFNATGLASGVYIYRLITDQKIMTKKLTLIR